MAMSPKKRPKYLVSCLFAIVALVATQVAVLPAAVGAQTERETEREIPREIPLEIPREVEREGAGKAAEGAGRFSLSNAIWDDADGDGLQGRAERGIAGVELQLFADAEADGLPDDTNGDRTVDAADALATVRTGAEGAYAFNELAAGNYVVGVAPSNFAAEGALSRAASRTPAAIRTAMGYALSRTIAVSEAAPTGGDGGKFAVWEPQFGMELALAPVGKVAAVAGDTVAVRLTATNTGTAFMKADIALGVAENGALVAAEGIEVAADGRGLLSITEPVAPGATVTRTFNVRTSAGGDLALTAEVSSAVKALSDGTAVTRMDGASLAPAAAAMAATKVERSVVVAPAAGRLSLSNKIWNDIDGNGLQSAGERAVAGVALELFADADANGVPDDRNGNRAVDSADAIARTVTAADGSYAFNELEAGRYVLGLAPSNFETGGALKGAASRHSVSLAPTAGYALSGTVDLTEDAPAAEIGRVVERVTADADGDRTVDFGVWFPEFGMDLALAALTTTAVEPGDTVEFRLDVTNTGTAFLKSEIEVDVVDNGRLVQDGIEMTADGKGLLSITEPLAPGDSVAMDFEVTATEDGDLEITAEVFEAVMGVSDGTVVVQMDGESLAPAEAALAETMVLGKVLIAGVAPTNAQTSTNAPAPAALALTGPSSGSLVFLSMLLIVLGAAMLAARSPLQRWQGSPERR